MTQLEDIGLERPSRWEWLKEMFRRDEGEHIVCPCRPKMNLCGRFDDTPMLDDPIDGSECRQCLRVLNTVGCPNCQCPQGVCCIKCCEDGCHE